MAKAPPVPPSQKKLQETRELPKPVLATPDVIFDDNEKVILYGPFGVGKTFCALTAPGPIWFLGIGGKNELKTMYSDDFKEKHGEKEVHITWVTEDRQSHGQMTDNPNGFDRVCDAIDGFLEWNEEAGLGVRTIIVDNATWLEHYMLNKAIAAEYHIGSSDVSKSVLKREREYGIRKPHDSTWGGAQSLMDNIVRWLFELPFNIVFVAHEYRTYTQIQGSRERRLVSIEPLFVGKQRTEIPNLFDNVWYQKKSGGGRNPTFNTQTSGDNIIAAKTRVGGPLQFEERDLDLTKAFEKLSHHPREDD